VRCRFSSAKSLGGATTLIEDSSKSKRRNNSDRSRTPAKPVVKDRWIMPAQGTDAEPIWGIQDGIAVGLWPTDGPRGLIRVYSPYLGQPRLCVMNYIAVEPVVAGRKRGASELENSAQDGVRGKAMWTSNEFDKDPEPRRPWEPASGKIETIDGVRTLSFFVNVERFDNGARVAVQVLLREDRPYEIGLRPFELAGSSPIKACILPATMGCYARLRRLWLKDGVVDSKTAWTEVKTNEMGFLPHREWSASHLFKKDADAIVAATTDETDPTSAAYDSGVKDHWKYQGKVATQYWRVPWTEKLMTRVDGRPTYWNSQAKIPGGVCYETWEMEEPFVPGQEFRFGITPNPPEEFGFGKSK
jgi:hypothetical protein